jgi:hypothetical protein
MIIEYYAFSKVALQARPDLVEIVGRWKKFRGGAAV